MSFTNFLFALILNIIGIRGGHSHEPLRPLAGSCDPSLVDHTIPVTRVSDVVKWGRPSLVDHTVVKAPHSVHWTLLHPATAVAVAVEGPLIHTDSLQNCLASSAVWQRHR